MISLIISILFLTATALCLADGTRRGFNVLTLNLIFRMTSGILGLVVLLSWVPLKEMPAAWSQVGGAAIAGGLCFWLSGLAAIQAVRTGHLGVTWTAKRCAMVFPTLASIIIWNEIPLWPISRLLVFRLSGIVLIVTVAVLLAIDRLHPHPDDQSKSASPAWVAWLVTCVLTYGAYGIILRASAAVQVETGRAAGVPEDLYISFAANVYRDLFLHDECTSYAVSPQHTEGNAFLFHGVSRDPSICFDSTISGMTVEIDPDQPELGTCAWITLPAHSGAVPLLMAGRGTPLPLLNGEAYQTARDQRVSKEVWERIERSIHQSKTLFCSSMAASAGAGSDREDWRTRADEWVENQSEMMMSILRMSGLKCEDEAEAEEPEWNVW